MQAVGVGAVEERAIRITGGEGYLDPAPSVCITIAGAEE
jgi:hypothetical protein